VGFQLTLPNRDTINTFGGSANAGYNDFSPAIDPTVDMPAAAGNQLLSDVAMLTRTTPRAWALFTPAGTGAPVLNGHQAMWIADQSSLPPVVARVTVGVYTMTWPSSVIDDITVATAPGYLGPQALNLLAGHGQGISATQAWTVSVFASANGASIYLFLAGSLADPSATQFSVFVY
jgi:hypothetical protein